jgi:Glucose dehydrogenase
MHIRNEGNMKVKIRSRSKFLILSVILLMISMILLLSVSCTGIKGAPPEVSKYSKDWPLPNQNYESTRAAQNSSISLKNISTLGVAWTMPITGISEWGAATTNPLILGNNVYMQDLKSNVYSIDFKTGKINWMKEVNKDIAGPAGVAVGYGKVFAVNGHFEIAAYDISNGNQLWSTDISGNQNIGVDIQPLVWNNIVYVSSVPGTSNANFYKGGAIGVLYALDQATGKVLWSFDTVDSKDVWGNPQVNSGGGSWYPPSIDTKTGMTYWGIGNAGPWPGTKDFPNGTSRPGPNLYSSSIIALDSSGKLAWYNQVIPHDLFDYDFQVSPIIANVKINGASQDVLFGAGKMGKVVCFDKATGKTVWSTDVGVHKNDTLKEIPLSATPIDVAPSPLGGVETVIAYSDGMVYAAVNDLTVQYTATGFVGTSFDFSKAKGELVALDASTGKIAWTKNYNAFNVGAATVVNDLVFTSIYDGMIHALNKKTGEEVWSYQASGPINGWPAVKGDTIIFPVGMGKTPALVAFRIGASGQAPAETTAAPGGSGKVFQQ